MSGLLVRGQVTPVAGVTIVGPHDAPWNHLSPGDCVARASAAWLRQWFLHKTIADDPEKIIDGVGPPGGAQRTITNWQTEFAAKHRYAGAAVVTGHDGIVACLCDLVLTETFHATVSNAWSVGHETCELVGGGVYRVALNSTVKTCLAGCAATGIQWQMPKLGSYTGHPIPRMIDGGPDMVGIFGHRDNTEERGRWDPGDAVFQMLSYYVEQFDYAAGEDKDVWGARQRVLNKQLGSRLTEDGVAGPATTSALRAAGYRQGIWMMGKASDTAVA